MSLKSFATFLLKHSRQAKHVRGNQIPFMTKNLSKNIMKRSRLRNKNLIIMNEIENFIPNKELIASLCLKKTKKAYLDERKVFWKTVKPSLSKKFIARERISLSKNGEIVKTEKGTAEVFNNF